MNRKTVKALGGLGLAFALLATACGTTEPSTPGGSGAQCEGKIGFFGALSGGNASIVLPSRDAAKLAFEQFSEQNADCKVELVEFDTEGEPAKAAPVANKIASDPSFLGVIGGAFSGETRQTKATYQEAGVAMVSASATATDLTLKDPVKVFHRVVGHDETQGSAAGKYLTDVLKAQKVFVVDDGTAYGGPLGDKVKSTLGAALVSSDKVQEKQTDFAAVISKIRGAGADAVFYAGYTNEAGPFLKQLRGAGLTITFVGSDGLYGDDFPKAAGAEAEGAVITCPCLPADKAKGSFAADYRAKYNKDPGAYAAEGFDAATIFLEALKAGKNTRKDVLDFVNAYDKDGITKSLKFDEKGDVEESKVVIWTYVITNGALVAGQEIPK